MKQRIAVAVSILIIILSALFASSKLLGTSFYTSHDGEGHVIRMIEYDEALHDGQLPVRMTKRINFGLGYPFFNFNYPAPYAIGQFFHELGLSFVSSFKVLMFLGTLLGGLSIFLFMRGHVDVLPSLVSALFYIFVPYRFLNMYVRGNPAENFALGLLPLLLWTVDRIISTQGKNYMLFVLVGSLFVLSHNTTVLMTAPLIGIYFFLRLTKKNTVQKILRACVISVFLIALVTSFFWAPVFVETRLTKLAELSEDYVTFFPTLKEVIYSPWGFGAYVQGVSPGKMSPQIGLVHILMFVGSVFLLLIGLFQKKKEHVKVMVFFIGIAAIALFLMLPISRVVWDTIHLLRFVQIPWRFLGIIAFCIACLAGFVVQIVKVPTYIKWIGCVLLVCMLVYANRNHIRLNQNMVFTNPFDSSAVYGPSTTSKDEHMPKSAPRIYTAPDPNGTIIPDVVGKSIRTTWITNEHTFNVSMGSKGMFRDNTSYFPGWIAKVDGKETNIRYAEDEYARLRVFVPEGTHTVEFVFTEIWYRKIFDIVSLVSFTAFGIWILVKKGKGI